MTLDWLRPSGDISRFGELVAINPEWHRLAALPDALAGKRENPQDPRAGGSATGANSAGLLSYPSPPMGESENQDERESRPAGRAEKPGPGLFQSQNSGTEKAGTAKASPENPPPRLSNIRPERDFPDTGRCLELFRQAVKCGLMPNASEHARLLWMAAIERARTVEAKNPAGVFLVLVKKRLWQNLSEGQFDAANARLKQHLFGLPANRPPLLVPLLGPQPLAEPARPPLSKDALLVRTVRAKLESQGQGQGRLLFHALRTHAGFSRERFEAALAELDGPEKMPAKWAGNAV